MSTLSSIFPVAMILFGSVSVGRSQFTLLSVAQIKNGGSGSELAISGHFVYLANLSDGLRVYDVSDPTNPVNIFHTNNSGAIAADVFVAGNLAYLANISDGLRIYDIANPSNAVEVGHFSNNYAPFSVKVTNGFAYIAASSAIEILNVTNPGSPTYVTARTRVGVGDQLEVSGNYLYWADGDNGMVVYDDSNLISPVAVAQTNNKGYATWVSVSGNIAYLANGTDGLRVYSITNPASPVNVGHKATGGFAYCVRVSGQYAYIAQSTGVVVCDVSDPSQPVIAGSASTSAQAFGLQVSGDFVYVANSTDGLRIFRLIPQLQLVPSEPQTLTLTWAITVANFGLEQNVDVGTANWVAVTNSPVVKGQKYQVNLPLSAPRQFFRLREQ